MADYALESTFDVKFTSRAFSTGIPTTLGGTPAVDIYEDNSVTQITGADTLTVDFDSVTGLNNLRIAATAANGFESGKSYTAVISTGTVGGVSVVGEVICNFTINRANIGAISNGSTAADNLQAACDNYSATRGLAGTALPAAAADAAGGLPISDAGGLDMDAILADTAALNDTKIPDTISLANINAQVDTALSDIGLDHLVSAAVIGTDVTDNSIVAKLVSSSATADWDSYVNTTDSLQATRDHIGDGTNLTEAGGTGDHLTALATASALTTVDTVVDGIKTQTDQLTFTGSAVAANVTYWNEVLISSTNPFDAVATAAALAIVDTNVDAILVDTGTTIPGTITTLQATATAIEADTQDLQTQIGTAGAGLTDLGGMSTAMKAEVNTEVDSAFTTQMADSVSTDGSIATREQALYMILQSLTDFTISGTTLTVRKVDGSTTLFTGTLNDGTNPTALTRAT